MSFLATYKQEHVPIEVEEWLSCFLHDPVESLQEATDTLCGLLEACPERRESRGYTTPESMIKPMLEPLKKFEEHLGIKVPPLAVRTAMGTPKLRQRLVADLNDYSDSIRCHGSTPHRRLARGVLDEPQQQIEGGKETVEDSSASEGALHISPSLRSAVGVFSNVEQETAEDEYKLIRLMTTFAEGCAAKGKYADAYGLMSDSLLFAHDEDSQSVIHANASIASLLDGRFEDAEYHGREAALLIPDPKRSPKAAARGYRMWATAAAYKDDYDRAESVIDDALTLLPDQPELLSTREKIHELRSHQPTGTPGRATRSHMLDAQLTRGVVDGSGTGFDNEFDWVVFKNKLYPPKMNPSSNEMGSVFRRVGDLGGAISTSRSTELL